MGMGNMLNMILLGFVVSFIYAVCHKLWLHNPSTTLVIIQYYLHIVGSLIIVAGLFLLYGGYVSLAVLDPILAVGSIMSLISLVMMKLALIKSFKVV